jgi:hypothetical protein
MEISDEDRLDGENLGEELFRLTHNQRSAVVVYAFARVAYQLAANWRRNALRASLQPTAGNIIRLRESDIGREAVPTAEGLEALLAAIGGEARDIRAFCAEICGEEGEEEEWDEGEDE